jgi:serine phosphatase RsbU (regulator of sigma subunit)
MSTSIELDPVLFRLLRRNGLASLDQAPTLESWTRVVQGVNDYFKHMAEDRALLARSIELSTAEMSELKERVVAQRDALRTMTDGIADALTHVGAFVTLEAVGSQSSAGNTSLETAKAALSTKLADIFANQVDQDSTAQFSGIHANLARLADELIRLLQKTASQAAVKKELEVASTIQRLLVPSEDLLERPGLQITGLYRPASECSGDWWSVYDLPDGRVFAVIGDVTGHGISSAIITGAAKAACDVALLLNQASLSSSTLLQILNAAIYSIGRRQVMMTLGLGAFDAFDPKARAVNLSSAGHPFPYLIRGSSLKPVVLLGQPLGAAADASYAPSKVELLAGDLLVWFTDGVIECENQNGEQFSERRLRAVCQRAASGGAVGVRDAVIEAVDAFRGESPQCDDVTLMVASIL